MAEDETLKKNVKAFFEAHHGEEIYPSDVARRFDLDYFEADKICRQLAVEGQIEQLQGETL